MRNFQLGKQEGNTYEICRSLINKFQVNIEMEQILKKISVCSKTIPTVNKNFVFTYLKL